MLALVSGARPAAAAEPRAPLKRASEDDPRLPKPMLALFTGATTALVSLGVGGTMIASGRTSAANTGILFATSGLSLAPLFAHGVVDEWGRGALFSLMPLAVGGGFVALMATEDDLLRDRATPALQWGVFGLTTAALFSSALGVLDAVRVMERQPARFVSSRARLSVEPAFDLRSAVLRVGGVL